MFINDNLPPWADEELHRQIYGPDGNDYGPDVTEDPPAPVAKKRILLGAQETAYERLLAIARVYFEGDWRKWSVMPRLVPLLIGPSGHGKSWLVSAVGSALNMEGAYLRVGLGSWVPRGSRLTRGTLACIDEHLSTHPKAIIHFDELDKFSSFRDDWSRACIAEMFDLLDRNVHSELLSSMSAMVSSRLQQSTWLVGSGTWQGLWNNISKPLGFGKSDSTIPDINAIRREQMIPEELLFRFGGELVYIRPWVVRDVEHLIASLKGSLPDGFLEELKPKAVEIAESHKGVRQIEFLLAKWLVDQKQVNL